MLQYTYTTVKIANTCSVAIYVQASSEVFETDTCGKTPSAALLYL